MSEKIALSEKAKLFIKLVGDFRYTLDDGPMLESVDTFVGDTYEDPNDVACTVTWTDGEHDFTEEFTFSAIENAKTDGLKINVVNTDGEVSSFKFYEVFSVNVGAGIFDSIEQSSKPKI